MKENKLIDGSSGVSPLGPSNKVKAALRKAVKRINNAPGMEIDGLKRLFESKYSIPSESILFANSLKELIYLVSEVLHPRRALVLGPALGLYEDAARAGGAEVLYLNAMETDGFDFEMSRIEESMKDMDMVFLANPNRITGKLISREKIREAATLPGRTHFVIDEALIEFAGLDDCLGDMLHSGNITILRTTACFYGLPGLSLAYAVSSPEVIRSYEKKKHWDLNLLSVEAARAACKDATYRKAVKQFVPFEKKMLTRMLHKIDWIRVYDTDSNILLLKIDKKPEDTAAKLRSAGLDIRDCGEIHGLDSSFFRVSVMKHENNLKLISVLKSVQQRRH